MNEVGTPELCDPSDAGVGVGFVGPGDVGALGDVWAPEPSELEVAAVGASLDVSLEPPAPDGVVCEPVPLAGALAVIDEVGDDVVRGGLDVVGG